MNFPIKDLDLTGADSGQDLTRPNENLPDIKGMRPYGTVDEKTVRDLMLGIFSEPSVQKLLREFFCPQAQNYQHHQENENMAPLKSSFLVFKNQKYTTVQTENIAFFVVRKNKVSIVGFDRQEYELCQSLRNITASVCARQFFRVNRTYLINFKAIREVEHYFMRKLLVRLYMETSEQLLINKHKTNEFLSWMSER